MSKALRTMSCKNNNEGETSMAAQFLRATSSFGMAAPKLRTACHRFLDALDAFAQTKARKAVPEHELRRAQREINRYRRLMHANSRLPPKTATAGH
jgi:hypothetical protein